MCMGDGLGDSRREEQGAARVAQAASDLADAVEDASDRALGLPPGLVEVLNEELERAGLRVFAKKKRRKR